MDREIDFGKRLRASEAASIQRVAIYLPDTSGKNEEVDLAPWITKGIHLLTDLTGGCTRLPMAAGTWHDEDGTTHEHTVVIYSYIRSSKTFFERLDELVAFVHDFGRSTSQKAMMVEFSGGDFGRYFNRAYFVYQKDYVNFEG